MLAVPSDDEEGVQIMPSDDEDGLQILPVETPKKKRTRCAATGTKPKMPKATLSWPFQQ